MDAKKKKSKGKRPKAKKKGVRAKAKRAKAPRSPARRKRIPRSKPIRFDRWPVTDEDRDLWRLWTLEAEASCWEWCGKQGINWYDPAFVDIPKPQKGKPGRKEFEVTDGVLAQIEAAAGQSGLSKEEIAWGLGISPATYYKFQKLYPEMTEAYKRGKALANAQVINKLFVNATEANKGWGSVAAQIYWTKARANWRENSNLALHEPDLDAFQDEEDEPLKLENTENDAALIIDILKEAGATEPDAPTPDPPKAT